MNKHFYKLRFRDWIYISLLMVVTYLWINYDQLIIKSVDLRMLAFIVLGFALMVGFYFAVNPPKAILLSNSMTLILVPLFIVLSIVIHVFVVKDGFKSKSIILWVITVGLIYLSGFIYSLINKKR